MYTTYHHAWVLAFVVAFLAFYLSNYSVESIRQAKLIDISRLFPIILYHCVVESELTSHNYRSDAAEAFVNEHKR